MFLLLFMFKMRRLLYLQTIKLITSGQVHSRFHQASSQSQLKIAVDGVSLAHDETCVPACAYYACLVWLAPSSIYSFYARLGLLMTEKLGLERPEICDEEVYPFMWCPRVVNETPDISGLPSIDHALYLFSTVKFNFNQIYRLFDEEVFVNHVKEFYYGNGVKKATECPLWFVQFLLLLAFGTAFTCRSNDPKSPPGASYFYRAMALMPELTCIWTHGVAAIEILALAGLYMYCMEHVKAAHLYVRDCPRNQLPSTKD